MLLWVTIPLQSFIQARRFGHCPVLGGFYAPSNSPPLIRWRYICLQKPSSLSTMHVVIDTINNPVSETSKQLSCPLLLWRHASLSTVIRSGESKCKARSSHQRLSIWKTTSNNDMKITWKYLLDVYYLSNFDGRMTFISLENWDENWFGADPHLLTEIRWPLAFKKRCMESRCDILNRNRYGLLRPTNSIYQDQIIWCKVRLSSMAS